MSKFEYVTVVVSIVMAFAISETLTGVGRLVRERSRVRFYWVHAAWMAYSVMWMLLHWWGIWDYRSVEFTTFFGFLALVAPSLTFVVLAFLVTPTLPPDGELDLREYYFRNHRWIFLLAALILVELTSLRTALTDEALLHPRNLARGLALGAAIWLAVSRDARTHAALMVVSFVGLVVYGAVRQQF